MRLAGLDWAFAADMAEVAKRLPPARITLRLLITGMTTLPLGVSRLSLADDGGGAKNTGPIGGTQGGRHIPKYLQYNK